MLMVFIWTMIVSFQSVSSEDLLTSFEDEIMSLEGETVTLSCNYSASTSYFYWYKQKSSFSPQFLISGYSEKMDRMSFKHNKQGKTFQLQISSAAVSDSAVYYCALQPGTSYGKFVFGSGIKLIIYDKNEYQPSYYKLEEKVDDKTLCLATGFSRHNATSTHEGYKGLFNSSSAIRIKDDSLYNQVIFTDDDGKNCEHGPSVGDCETNLKGDEMVNLVSLTVTGLRVIFIKTIIFNILMTLRLWLSQ
ncbi:T cell receptor alpha chain MC.7.G5-like isoform 9-T9 [Pholidichthys leucotaenia]